jgi:hypothetical protein
MKNINWASVEEPKEYERLVPGGYICRIVKVEDLEDKEYLKIYYDIAFGDFKDYYKNLFEAKNFWGGNFIRSYKETAMSFFKGFLTAIEGSNQGFKADAFNGDINTLLGKFIGLVLAEEEYAANDGAIKTRLYVFQNRSVESIKNNDFKVPELKKISQQQAGFVPVNDTDLPF